MASLGWPKCGSLLRVKKFCRQIFALIFALLSTKRKGSLAQLVQSICLTSRGSGVRTPQLPQMSFDDSKAFLFSIVRDSCPFCLSDCQMFTSHPLVWRLFQKILHDWVLESWSRIRRVFVSRILKFAHRNCIKKASVYWACHNILVYSPIRIIK